MLLPRYAHAACALCSWRCTVDNYRRGRTAYGLVVEHLTDHHPEHWGTAPAPITSAITDDPTNTLRGVDRLL